MFHRQRPTIEGRGEQHIREGIFKWEAAENPSAPWNRKRLPPVLGMVRGTITCSYTSRKR